MKLTNGKPLNNEDLSSQTYDEEREYDSGIDMLEINSEFVNVRISVGSTESVKLHMYGTAASDGEICLVDGLQHHKLKLDVHYTGSTISGDLNLDIVIPSRKLDKMSVHSSSGNIIVADGTDVDYMRIKTMSGDVDSNARLSHALVSTMSGDIHFFIDARNNIDLDITSMSGDAEIGLNNTGYLDLSTSTMSGDVRNHHHQTGGFEAAISVSTMSGDITIL